MLALPIVEEIQRLLAEGRLSQRKIAARMGVSRGTVGAIANGRRGIWGKENESDDLLFPPESPPERCDRCGYTVVKPCVICSAREYRNRQKALGSLAAATATSQPEKQSAPVRSTQVQLARVA